ncbi:hypothetical protein [Acidipropionibacterium jensenii]|uniref:hypothetical protein n=1 Tax=Acidipropionibacterium jensenii TaxID=1749 RepID=UPI00264864A8|nr:hypothetical protein [Acidipropionibacterium jensenii]MDN6555678.1 hypothetical protein [Acidipropionibacterium acidipropionici]MDN6761295.1 hypothetical protein [Acidipropionibacterium jensenii]MDN6814422.1 hypothetical protein [Corynebacterium variabile]
MHVRESPFADEAREMAAAFAPAGWAFFGHWHLEQSRRILALSREGASRQETDQAITDVWNTEQPVLLRNIAMPLGRFGRGIDLEFQRRSQQRQTLINEAIQCHQEGRFAAAITLTLTQIDGITREVVGTTFFKANAAPTEADYTDDSTLAGIEGNLPAVRRAFSQPVDKVGRYGLVSRHGVIHGQDLSFATKVNSTKTLVLVGALAEHLESRADDRARRWRRVRDREKSSRSGRDANGRLLDDRGLEELYMFRADFETWVYNQIAFERTLEHRAAVERAHAHLEERGLSRRNFDLPVVEHDRVMWTFRSPGGQFLGSALAMPDVVSRPIPDQRWTWDSTAKPASPPWVISEGWTIAQGDPTTPNWAFRGFYTG